MEPTLAQQAFIPLMDVLRDLVHIFKSGELPPSTFLSISLEFNNMVDLIVASKTNSLSDHGITLASSVICQLDSFALDLPLDFSVRQLAALKAAHLSYIINQIGGSFTINVDKQYWPDVWVAEGSPFETT